jgi:archaetidylinositol phosphate synthase
VQYDGPMSAARPTLGATRKRRQGTELLCETVFRPLAHLVVLVLAPLRVPPPAVVLAGFATGLAAAAEIARGDLITAAVLLQVKTVLDNADGQLARATGRVTALGRYLDSESDLVVDAALFAGIGHLTGRYWLALLGFVVLTLVLSVNFNMERLYRREHGAPRPAPESLTGAEAVLARSYEVLYGWQDRMVERLVERRLRGAGPAARLAYHDPLTISILANYGLSTQLAVLGVCLAGGQPTAYVLLVLVCGLSLVPLAWRRDRLARRAALRHG